MGSNISTQITKSVKEEITNMSTDYLSETLKKVESPIYAEQIQRNNFKGAIIRGCNISNVQNMDIDSKVYDLMSKEQENDFQKQLDARLPTLIDTIVKQKNSELNIGQTNINTVSQNLSHYSFTDLSSKISSKVHSNLNASIEARQNQENIFEGVEIGPFTDKNGNVVDITCDIENAQNMIIRTAVESAMNSSEINKTIDKAKKDLTTGITSETEMANVGINPLYFILIIPIIIAVVILILYGIARLLPTSWLARKMFKIKK